MTETAAVNISQAVDFEMKRIRRALETSDGDKEDLITYAKEVVSLRYPAPAVFASRHNDETGECEPVEVDPPMLAKLRERMSDRASPTNLENAERAEMEPKVKALEWSAEDNGEYIAVSVIGWFHIGRPSSYWNLTTPHGVVSSYETLEAAKAAAQSDFASRIRSCLLDKPEAGEGEKPGEVVANRPEWIWYCESTSGVPVVTFGRWPKHPQQVRYKLAEIQPTEHDHPTPPAAPSPVDRVDPDA